MNLGRYQLMGKLASGGMAEVYLAKAAGPMGFEKKLVVKRILPHLAEDSSFIEMFFSEARLVALLNHPNIVQIFDFGEADGAYFLAMEYIDGFNLRTLLKRAHATGGPLPVPLCAKIVSTACEGLAYAHEFVDPTTGKPLQLVHRDISPDNILVSSSGAVKLVDFGIAKAANQMHRTQTGVVKGKVAYMPPEQLQGKALDARADLFALGVVLYELLSGQKPFEAESEAGMMQAILFEPPVPVTERRGDVPTSIQRVLERALAKDRNARYASCRELQMDLERYLRTCEDPVGPIDIARLVARISSLEQAKTERDPGARPPPEVPPSNSLVAPAAETRNDFSPSQGKALTRGTAAPTEVTPPPRSGPSPAEDDSIPTAPVRPSSMRTAPRRWPRVAALCSAVLVLASMGLWRATRPAQVSAAPVAQTVPEEPPSSSGQEGRTNTGSSPTSSGPNETALTGTLPTTPTGNPPPAGPTKPLEPTNKTEVPPPEPPKPETELAFFRVESTVEGSVRVNNKLAGRTPVVMKDLPPGKVTVEIFDKQQGFSKRQVFELKPGDNGVLRLKIGKGKLAFRVRPYATVILDGRKLGLTPLNSVEVYEGRHTIKLINEELKRQVEEEYVVKAGGDHVYTANLNDKR
ncbi:serine/threonine-protein kinase [Archangium gephyra]|uniref:Serine/threonine protein kinase PrkC, regulator of stationary phase n=1 Tax=Archangium gephyra TaxID=48 RepID=A0AAC8QB31_9BACT|nr:serine/threonine-protein kinase [Archangium gephyra]AKJ04417.1 Serine/threonine protein kinase PrkC, regulator of stationary phase [Archangium gephyra]REG37507.1 serine/threonine-protein kinase [Archangium gephyra]